MHCHPGEPMMRRAAYAAINDWELVIAFGGIAVALGLLTQLALEMLP